MSFIDDLRTIDYKQPGNWPWLIKAAALVLLFVGIEVAAYFFLWSPQIDDASGDRLLEVGMRGLCLAEPRTQDGTTTDERS